MTAKSDRLTVIEDDLGAIALIKLKASFKCETYSCTMSKRACIKRQEMAKKVNRKDAQTYKPGYHDPNCKDCEQGKEIAESSKLEAESTKGGKENVKAVKPGSREARRLGDQGAGEREREGESMTYSTKEIEEFIRDVCAAEGITVKDLRSGQRYGSYSIARLKIVPKLRDEYKLKFKKIGDMVGCTEPSAWAVYNRKGKPPAPPVTQPKKPADVRVLEAPSNKNVITIDFSDYPEDLERLKKIAKEELRTPAAQMVYWIRKHVK